MKNKIRPWSVRAFFYPFILFFALLDTQAKEIPLPFDPYVIYGEDNRRDLFNSENQNWLKLADSTVALFDSNRVKRDPKKKTAKLSLKSYGKSQNLCRSEPFYSQPTGAFCSGSLVGPDLVLTAGHCFDSDTACFETQFIFGFGIKSKETYPKKIPLTEVYSCAGLLVHYHSDDGPDFALIRLDRPVLNHVPLQINRTQTLVEGESLVVIGHPSGLPTKIADGASLRTVLNDNYFVANLDTYAGNSGSPVFHATTGLIEGILVSGETDFVYTNECRVSNRCKNDGCSGEQVMRTSVIAAHIPKSTTETMDHFSNQSM